MIMLLGHFLAELFLELCLSFSPVFNPLNIRAANNRNSTQKHDYTENSEPFEWSNDGNWNNKCAVF